MYNTKTFHSQKSTDYQSECRKIYFGTWKYMHVKTTRESFMNILVIMAKASKLHQEWLSLWCLLQGVQGVHDIIMQLIPLNYIPQKILTWPFKTHPNLILPINIEVNNKKKNNLFSFIKGECPGLCIPYDFWTGISSGDPLLAMYTIAFVTIF